MEMNGVVVLIALLVLAQLGWCQNLNLVPLDIGVGCGRNTSYPTRSGVMSFAVYEPKADLLLLHFSMVKLKRGDYLTIRPVFNQTAGNVLEVIGDNAATPMFSRPIYTPQVTIELHTTGQTIDDPLQCFGFHIDGVRTSALDGSKVMVPTESVCGVDDSKNTQCYISTPMYTASKAVLRLLTNRPGGSSFCTGWLLGCEGHMLTNQHCIKDEEDADNTIFEFMAEGLSCSAPCNEQGSCSQQPFTRGALVIATSAELDYSLVKLTNIPPDAGFLQLRASGPRLHEQVYIPQHPLGWGKRIAVMDGNSPGSITSLTLNGCATNQAGYLLDTQPGSSGSPVIATSDNKVVALHHCGGCPNAGVQSTKLIRDLQLKGVLPRCSVY